VIIYDVKSIGIFHFRQNNFVELTYFFNDNKEKKNVSVSYKASFCGSPPPPKQNSLATS
jgi:hypothetical protein